MQILSIAMKYLHAYSLQIRFFRDLLETMSFHTSENETKGEVVLSQLSPWQKDATRRIKSPKHQRAIDKLLKAGY